MQKKKTLSIFNIQRYSLHDGTGIRTIIFLKGCPLRCRWCCNPESQNFSPDLMFRRSRCIGEKECGYCGKVCSAGAVSFDAEGKAAISFSSCSHCFSCTEICPSQALKKEGRTCDMDTLLDIAEADAAFYVSGEGGVTLSGGEPLAQENAVEFLRRARQERYLNTAVETCGYVPKERLLQAAAYLDQIFWDIKSLNDEKHREYTGFAGDLIRENLKALCREFPDLPKTVRTPVIPGFNDSPEELKKIETFLQNLPGVTWEKLPYHTFGVGKYEMLGRNYLLDNDKASQGEKIQN